MSLRTGVRVGLVAIFTAILSLVFVEDARSQPGRPRPGSITGMPGGVTGIPRPPSFPQPPSIPRPPTFTPPNIPSPPSFPRGPSFETVWSCGKCRAELGRGNSKPSFDACPKCGARFVNGGGGGNGGGFGLISPPPPADVGGGATSPSDPDLMPRGATGNSGAIEPPTATSPPPSASGDSNAKPEEKPASKTGSLILKIMIGVFAVLFLIGIAGGAFLIVAANKGSKPTKKSRRVRDDDDE